MKRVTGVSAKSPAIAASADRPGTAKWLVRDSDVDSVVAFYRSEKMKWNFPDSLWEVLIEIK